MLRSLILSCSFCLLVSFLDLTPHECQLYSPINTCAIPPTAPANRSLTARLPPSLSISSTASAILYSLRIEQLRAGSKVGEKMIKSQGVVASPRSQRRGRPCFPFLSDACVLAASPSMTHSHNSFWYSGQICKFVLTKRNGLLAERFYQWRHCAFGLHSCTKSIDPCR